MVERKTLKSIDPSAPDLTETQFGFAYGPVGIVRMAYLKDRGYFLLIITPYVKGELHISPTGRKIHFYPIGKSLPSEWEESGITHDGIPVRSLHV